MVQHAFAPYTSDAPDMLEPSSAFGGLARHHAGWSWVQSMSTLQSYSRMHSFGINVWTDYNEIHIFRRVQ